MFSRSSLLAIVAFATLSTTTVLAQTFTTEELEACQRNLIPVSNEPVREFRTDDTSFFNVSYTYDPAICTSQIPIRRSSVFWEMGDNFYQCTLGEFDGTGQYNTQCSRTYGQIAVASRDQGEDIWVAQVAIGALRNARTVQQLFQVVPVEPSAPGPEPSGAMKRRRDTQHVFDCPIGFTYCWTGQGQDYACMNTSSDVSACGQCPFAFGSEIADCTSIEGVDDVECRNSRCVVNACQRGFQISLDRTQCVDARKRSKPTARGLLF